MLEDKTVSIVGLGYVGLPLAMAFAPTRKTIGFDRDQKKVDRLLAGVDLTSTFEKDQLLAPIQSGQMQITSDPTDLKNADIHIIAVPTPVDEGKRPDLSALIGATEVVGNILKKGDLVIFESTVFPGATEEICLPILEKLSGLKFQTDFHLGYSPERVNPGDDAHSLSKIVKVVSGCCVDSLKTVSQLYSSIITVGVFEAKSIKVAEAAKVIENTQRDVNIALMNELALIFDKLDLPTSDILEAAQTKWNFLKFTPGLVGGHCIGVDPYYLTYKAESVGHHPEVILSGRRINDSMGHYIAQKTIKKLIAADHPIKGSRVTILGVTFKENCGDTRNSKVFDIIQELQSYGIDVQVYDPRANPEETYALHGVELRKKEELRPSVAVIGAVKHQEFLSWTLNDYQLFSDENSVLIDVKGFVPKNFFKTHWNL